MSGGAETIAFLGWGPVARAHAAVLVERGYEVKVYADLDHRTAYDKTKALGYVKAHGERNGEYPVICCDDIRHAILGVKHAFMLAGGMGQMKILEALAEAKAENINLIAIPDMFFSALAINILGRDKGITACGTSSSPYGCRDDDEGIFIKSIKPLEIAAFPGKVSDAYKSEVEVLFPARVVWVKSTLRLAIASPGPVIHPVALLTNIGRVENQESFYFYREGMTKAVCNIIEASNTEMVGLGKACGYDDIPHINRINDISYPRPDGRPWASFHKFATESYSHNATKGAPKSIPDRYFLEDIPHSLVPCEQIAVLAHYDCENISALITLAGSALQMEVRKEGVTLKALGMKGLSLEEVVARFECGA